MHELPHILRQAVFYMRDGGTCRVIIRAHTAKWEVYTREGARYLRDIFIPKTRGTPTDVIKEFERQCHDLKKKGGTPTKPH